MQSECQAFADDETHFIGPDMAIEWSFCQYHATPLQPCTPNLFASPDVKAAPVAPHRHDGQLPQPSPSANIELHRSSVV
jgi:hypothetical protein